MKASRSWWGVLLILVMMSGLTACSAPELTLEERADALRKAVADYKTWTQHPDHKGVQKSKDGTHGKSVQVWVNSVAAGVIGKFDKEFPNGTIIVKRGYDSDDDSKPRAFITVMQKIKGFDPDNGDWFTASIPDDSAKAVSMYTDDKRKSGCMGCHSAGKDSSDYILFVKKF
jgi:streptogramin lyase